jgi:hypothetical protein
MFEFTNRNDDILNYFLMRKAYIPEYVKNLETCRNPLQIINIM